MRPDSEPDEKARCTVARRRIEFREITPHSAMLVPRDEHRAVPARSALLVHRLQRIRDRYCVARVTHAPAKIEIFDVQK